MLYSRENALNMVDALIFFNGTPPKARLGMQQGNLESADPAIPPEKGKTQGQRSVRKTVDKSDIHLFKTAVLRALSDETRQGIIVLLGKYGSLYVNDLAAYFNVSRPTVSHHLHVLKEARIVRSEKVGKEIYYSLNVRFLRRTIQNLLRMLDSIEPVKDKKTAK